ncbi:MAG: Gldg family protein [Clostridia bacterium]|nr:Gldg family protein [Clostridia bacterium]
MKRFSRLRGSALSTALVAAALAALIGVSLLVDSLEEKNGWRQDYSFNSVATTGETTVRVLESLPHPAHIIALFSRGQEDAPLLELLKRYAAISPKVTWEQTDLRENPGLLTKYEAQSSDQVISNDSLIVTCGETGRFRVLDMSDFLSVGYDEETGGMELISLTYERAITSALRYVTADTVPRALILQGHGELDEAGTADLAELLASNGMDVAYFTLSSEEAELREDDLILLLSPTRDLTDGELQTLSDFAKAGGSFLFTCDYTDPVDRMPNYAALLRSYGFQPLEGAVIASSAEKNTFYNGNRLWLIPIMQNTDFTRDLVTSHADSLLLTISRGFALPGESDRDLSVSTVLLSGQKAYLRSLSGLSTSLEKQVDDLTGPFALGLYASRITSEGALSRAFVLGSSTLLTSTSVWSMTDAQEFIIRLVNTLSGSELTDLSIMARSAVRPRLSVTSAGSGVLICVLLPLLAVIGAAAVLFKRKTM